MSQFIQKGILKIKKNMKKPLPTPRTSLKMVKKPNQSSISRVSRPPQSDPDSYYENLSFHTMYEHDDFGLENYDTKYKNFSSNSKIEVSDDFDAFIHERFYGHGYSTFRTSDYSNSENENSDYKNLNFNAHDFVKDPGCNASYTDSDDSGISIFSLDSDSNSKKIGHFENPCFKDDKEIESVKEVEHLSEMTLTDEMMKAYFSQLENFSK